MSKIRGRKDPSEQAAVERGLLPYFLAVRLEWLFLGLMLAGFGLIIASWLIGVDDVRFAPRTIGNPETPLRQVGYLAALNWGITYLVFFPVIAVMLVGVLQDIPHVLAELENLHVLRADAIGGAATSIVKRWKAGTFTRTVFI